MLVAALLGYGALAIDAAFFPLPIQGSLIAYERTAPHESPWVVLVPLQSGLRMLAGTPDTAVEQLGGNIALFVPFGFMVPLLCRSRPSAARILTMAFGASMAVEAMQLALSATYGYPYRLASADDVLLNVLGAAIGYHLYRLTRPVLEPVLGEPIPDTPELLD